jgi:hypothetical protein
MTKKSCSLEIAGEFARAGHLQQFACTSRSIFLPGDLSGLYAQPVGTIRIECFAGSGKSEES